MMEVDKTVDIEALEALARLTRYWILMSTTEAGSGHPTSSLSSVELMVALMFGNIFRFELDDKDNLGNDRLIFSKGHASPLMYTLYAVAGRLSEAELKSLRKFGSPLEGHPTPVFPFAEAATGSLGQGLPIGVGMALGAKYLDKTAAKTYVLLGDSEMAEGSNWEAVQIAAHYQLNNLVGIIDVNRLGQRGETMYGHDVEAYHERISAFGWQAIVVDGHSLTEVLAAYAEASASNKPVMIIAKTVKGKGVALVEDREGWHGKALSREQFKTAVLELGDVDTSLRGDIAIPEATSVNPQPRQAGSPAHYDLGDMVATRQAYGRALVRLARHFPEMVVLDAEVSNSSYTELFKDAHPERFFEMYIGEQNMVGTALGLALRGKIPFISTFAAFFTRAYDQIRMAAYSGGNIKFAGTHAGVSIGEDGPSQMGLEDIAMFRAVNSAVVLYPSDAVSCEKLVELATEHTGMVYIRLSRPATAVIYASDEDFTIGGSKLLKSSEADVATIVSAGVTLHEALAAYEELRQEDVFVRVIDIYSIKPLDTHTLKQAARETGVFITVEDHVVAGGLGEAVRTALAGENVRIHSLAVEKTPRSGKPEVLLDYEGISAAAIVRAVKDGLGDFGT